MQNLVQKGAETSNGKAWEKARANQMSSCSNRKVGKSSFSRVEAANLPVLGFKGLFSGCILLLIVQF